MEKIYTYKNGTVIIIPPTDEQVRQIKKATEKFLQRLMKERLLDGDFNTSGDIKEK